MMECGFAFYTDEGGRKNNEDAYIAKRIDQDYLFIVADGLGGHGDGEIAARTVVDSIREYILKNPDWEVEEAIRYANETVLEQQEQMNSKMKSTVTVAYITDTKTILAHVGDSRIYAFKDEEIVYQSVDHSAAQMAVSVGEIELSGIRNHPDRNLLTRAVGAGEKLRVDKKELSASDYDSLLLCSDGFWEYVLEEEMIKTRKSSRTPDQWLYKMRGLQLEKAPPNCDNNTAIAIIL